MSSYNTDPSDFEIEISNTLENVSEHPIELQSPMMLAKMTKIEHDEFAGTNGILFDTHDVHCTMPGSSQFNNYNEEDLKNDGNAAHGGDEYNSEFELHSYLNYINSSTEPHCPSKAYGDNSKSESLDEFFQDFYEIISSEMKSSPYERTSTTLDSTLTLDDQNKNFQSTVSGVDFNLDLNQFYVDTGHESDILMLQSPDMRTDFSTQLQSQYEPYNETKSDSVAVQQSDKCEKATEFVEVNAENEFYVDFKVNDDVTEKNSIITYVNKSSVQSLDYINESGLTETVMYVDQSSDDQPSVNNAEGVTQYEIIDFDACQYQNQSVGATLQTYQIDNLDGEHSIQNEQVTFHDNSFDVNQQPDLLSTLLSDKNNKIIIIAKPLRNPKIKNLNDELYSTYNEFDCSEPKTISYSKRPTIRGSRKQKLELINQIDSSLTKPIVKRGRPTKACKMMITNFLPETPKLPSTFVRDRKPERRRKRPRKLIWDSESDWDNTDNCIDTDFIKD